MPQIRSNVDTSREEHKWSTLLSRLQTCSTRCT